MFVPILAAFLSALIAASPGGATAPRPNQPLERSVTEADYPARALAAREQGRVHVRLLVNVIGRVTACDILESSGSAQLDAASCSILQRRARFHPATDDRGGRVAGQFDHQLSWQLP